MEKFTMRQKTDEEIIELCQMGDEEAFEELYKRFYKSTYYLAMQIANCDADAIDATQETFIEIHKSIKNLREIKVFRLWVKRIVVSKLNKIFAKNKDSLYDDDDIIWKRQAETRNYMIPQSQSRFRNDQELIHQFVENLSMRYRTIVVLTYFEEMNYKEVAAVCGIPEGTVKSRLNMAKKVLREQIIDYERTEGAALDFHSVSVDALLIKYFMDNANGFQLPASTGVSALHSAAPVVKSTFSFSSIAAKAGMAIAAAAIAAGGIYLVGEYIDDNFRGRSVVADSAFQTVTTDDGTISTAEEAYNTLKLWAHCYIEMEGKTGDEIAGVRPIYEALKNSGSTYYQLLVDEEWSNRFEEIAY